MYSEWVRSTDVLSSSERYMLSIAIEDIAMTLNMDKKMVEDELISIEWDSMRYEYDYDVTLKCGRFQIRASKEYGYFFRFAVTLPNGRVYWSEFKNSTLWAYYEPKVKTICRSEK